MPRLLLLLALWGVVPVHADTLTIPLGQQGGSNVPVPARGETQQAVLSRFGLADEEHPPVGRPPITRWDYREFSVYFESGRVIDSVVQHRPAAPAPPPASR